MRTSNFFLSQHGLTVWGKKLHADKRFPNECRAFISELRTKADECDKQALATTAYKARLLNQNARAARKEADRLESEL